MSEVARKEPYITDDWKVSGRIYRDPEIFEQEMDRIYGRTWVYVGHESEVADGGDYKTARIGRQPVIVSRSSDDGSLSVLFNRCRHRGSAVCQQEIGNSNYFRCAYHGWTYGSDGRLIGVPFDDGYGESFDKSQFGLVHVPRVDSYRGFIFASLSAHVPPLVDYLGNAGKYLDFIADIGDGIELSAHAHKLVFNGNWKLQIENTIDPYHFSFTHQSWLDILKERNDGKSSPWVKNVRTNKSWRGIDLEGGHGVHEYGGLGVIQDAHEIAIGELIPFNLNIFPSLAFVGAHLRLVVPVSVDKTYVYLYPIFPVGADEDTRSRILRDHEAFYGPSGFGSTDDIEVGFDRVTRGMSASASTEDYSLMRRGLHREELDPETGLRTGRSSDEVPQRAYLRRWLELMEDETDAE